MKTVFMFVSIFGFLGCASPAPDCKCAQLPVVVAQRGEACGGSANIGCSDDTFCDYANEDITYEDANGICMTRPTQCDDPVQVPGVCAYNGIRYINACTANKMGYDAFPSSGENTCD